MLGLKPLRLVASFSLAVTSAAATVLAEENTPPSLSFSCDVDTSEWTSRQDALQHHFSSVVIVSTFPAGGLGSGFFIDNDGYIVTNAHVLDRSFIGFVTLYDTDGRNFEGRQLPYTIVGRDRNTDIAVLKVEMDQPTNCIPMNSNNRVNYFDEVFAIGHPFGRSFTLSDGIVSMPKRYRGNLYTDYVQTNVSINPGNSGGPLFDKNFEFVAVNTAMISLDYGSAGLSLSVPVDTVVRVADGLIREGEMQYGMAGLDTEPVITNHKNVKVLSVLDYSAADLAGFEVGDLVVGVEGNAVRDYVDLFRSYAFQEPGSEVTYSVLRDGIETEVTIKAETESDYMARLAAIESLQQAVSLPMVQKSSDQKSPSLDLQYR